MAVGLIVTWPTAGVVGGLLIALYAAVPSIRSDIRETLPTRMHGFVQQSAVHQDAPRPDPGSRPASATATGRWDPRLNRVEAALANCITDTTSIENIAERAGLSLARVRRGGTPINLWHAILVRAIAEGKVEAILKAGLDGEPVGEIREAVDDWKQGGRP